MRETAPTLRQYNSYNMFNLLAVLRSDEVTEKGA
jgi:hypothetical protein